MMIQLKELCLISKPPTKICRDNQNNLHSTTGYAVEFADGYGQHYLWGVYFSPETFQKYIVNKASVKEVFALENQEQRAAIIKHIGYETLLAELPKLKKLDYNADHKATLYQFEFDSQSHPQFLMLEDFSSTRRYFIGVVDTCKTALEALASSFQTPAETYAQLKQES